MNPTKNPTLYLHVGMPKSASSTIQKFLLLNHEALAKQQIRYDFSIKQAQRGQGNGGMLAKFDRDRDSDAFKTYCKHVLRKGDSTIISSEYLVQRYRSDLIAWLVNLAAKKGLRTVVILIFRRQDLYIESAFKQQIKGGRNWVEPFEELVLKKQPLLNYFQIAKGWADLVGDSNLKILYLANNQPKEYVIQRLLESLGISQASSLNYKDVFEVNVSPSSGLVEPARLIKKDLIEKGLKMQEITFKINSFFSLAPSNLSVPARKFIQTYSVRSGMVKKHAELNMQLKHRFHVDENFDSIIEYDSASEAELLVEAMQVYKEAQACLPWLWEPTSQL
jgi:hypothetical protein